MGLDDDLDLLKEHLKFAQQNSTSNRLKKEKKTSSLESITKQFKLKKKEPETTLEKKTVSFHQPEMKEEEQEESLLQSHLQFTGKKDKKIKKVKVSQT